MILKFKSKLSFLLAGMLACFLCSTPIHALWQQPPHPFGSSIVSVITIASDANGHAIALPNSGSQVLASYYSSGIWSDPPQVIGPGSPGDISLYMEEGGTALAIWYDELTGNINTAFFDGFTWSTPSPDPLDTIASLNSGSTAVSMNGPNQGVAMWIDNATTTVHSSFFSAGTWSAPVTIGTGNFHASIAYSANGTVVAGWLDLVNGTTVANYTGGAWQAPVVLDPTGSQAVVGIDSSGKAIAVWANGAGNVATSTFNGIAWSAIQFISLTTGNSCVDFKMTPSGTAVATWVDSSSAGFSSSYNGTAWSAPIQFTAGPISFTSCPSLSVADNGNALVEWVTSMDIRSSQLPLGGVWTPEEVIVTLDIDGTDVRSLTASLSENGTAFAAWVIASEGSFQFASVELPPVVLPPTNLTGFTCTNRFASQSDRVNTLIWTPSPDPTVVAYILRRNGVLIATIPATAQPIYQDHNRCKNVVDVYTLTAVDATGLESTPVSISLL